MIKLLVPGGHLVLRCPYNDQWLAAAKGSGPAPLANFELQSPVTEAFLLGCLAQRFPGEKLEWDSANMRITSFEKANKLVDPPARSGFGA